MNNLPHFMVLHEGKNAYAKIDFSEISPKGTKVFVTMELCVEYRYWDDFIHEVNGLFRFKVRPSEGSCPSL